MKILHWLKEKLLWSDRNDEKMKKLLKKYWKELLIDIGLIVLAILVVLCIVQDIKRTNEKIEYEREAIMDGRIIY